MFGRKKDAPPDTPGPPKSANSSLGHEGDTAEAKVIAKYVCAMSMIRDADDSLTHDKFLQRVGRRSDDLQRT